MGVEEGGGGAEGLGLGLERKKAFLSFLLGERCAVT